MPAIKRTKNKRHQYESYPAGGSSETYNIASDTQNVDKRPLGPTARPYCLIHNSGDGYDAFANDDQGKESHSHVEMCVLETYTGSGAGYPHHHPHLEPK